MAAALGAIVLSVLAAVAAGGAPQIPRSAPEQSRQLPQTRGTSPAADLFSIERIRKQIERQPAINLTPADRGLPLYRVSIEGYEFKLPTWKATLIGALSGPPIPPGGAEFARMQWMATKPAAWGVAW